MPSYSIHKLGHGDIIATYPTKDEAIAACQTILWQAGLAAFQSVFVLEYNDKGQPTRHILIPYPEGWFVDD